MRARKSRTRGKNRQLTTLSQAAVPSAPRSSRCLRMRRSDSIKTAEGRDA